MIGLKLSTSTCRKTITAASMISILAGCTTSVDNNDDFISGSCIVDTGQTAIDTDRSTAVRTIAELIEATNFTDGVRVNGALPLPETPAGGSFSLTSNTGLAITVKDRTSHVITITGADLAPGKRIGALFFQYQDSGSFFAIPVNASDISETGDVNVTYNGPSPEQNINVLIQAIISSEMSAFAYIIDDSSETPELSVLLDDTSAANWATSSSTLSISTDTEVFLATRNPVSNTAQLNDAVTFDGAEIISGSIPTPATASGGQFQVSERIILTDKSAFDLSLTPKAALPGGMRIGAVFFQFSGTDSYFAVPVDINATQDAVDSALALRAEVYEKVTSADTVTSFLTNEYAFAAAKAYNIQQRASNKAAVVTMRGPFPQLIGGTLIADSFISEASISAFLIPEDESISELSNIEGIPNITDPTRWLTAENSISTQTFKVGTGAFNVMMAWNQNNTDIDLWVWEPSTPPHKIYYGDKDSELGNGRLDFDNTTGFGPENIYFDAESSVPVGSYDIEVDYFGGSVDTEYTVVLNICSNVSVVSGTFNLSPPDGLSPALCASDLADPIANSCTPREAFRTSAGGSEAGTHYISNATVSSDCPILQAVVVPDPPRNPNIFERAAICDLDTNQPSEED